MRNSDLSEKILGDIQNYDLPASEFDLIICWWVLEHLQHPQKALENCLKALKRNGAVVIASPNIFSIKGMITKLTPQSFHLWVYKYVFGYKKIAKTEDCPPFRTFLKYFIAPKALSRFAIKNQLSV